MPDRVLLTGASRSGIGGAVCRRLARDGTARMVISATGRDPGLKLLAAELEDLGAAVLAVPGDLSDAEFPGELAREAAAFCGGLDTVVSNAGRSCHGQLNDISLADWDAMLHVHARAAWLLAKAAFPFLAESRGSLIATGSVSGTSPHADHGAYPVAKAALIMLCQVLAMEWAPAGVRVNVVSPGPVATPASAKAYAPQVIPLGRPGLPGDIAGVVAFLAGPDAAFITGENIVADGGLTRSVLERIPRYGHG